MTLPRKKPKAKNVPIQHLQTAAKGTSLTFVITHIKVAYASQSTKEMPGM